MENVQRVKAEPRDEGPRINVITCSGMATAAAEEKVAAKPLIRKAVIKQEGLDLQKEKETFVAARKYFDNVEVSTSQAPANFNVDDEVKPFLQAYMKLLHNQRAIENLQALINSCTKITNPPLEVKDVHKLYKHKKHTDREMWLTAQIGDYEMDQAILDLGLDVNVLPKQTWHGMGESKLESSTIQLRMANQQKIIPLGRLSKIAGVKIRANFEVIQIVEDADPYPALLGLDWAIDMGGIINLKKISMVFENEGTWVIVPSDLTKGEWYMEPMREEEDVDHIYKLTAQDEDWINPTMDGVLCWEKDNECFSDSDGEIENW